MRAGSRSRAGLRLGQGAAEQDDQGDKDYHGNGAQDNFQARGNPLDTSVVMWVDNIATMNTIFGYETKHS